MGKLAHDLSRPMAPAQLEATVMRAQEVIGKMPQVEAPIRHLFADGLYAREMTICRGMVFVGRLHLQSQVNIISKGDISVLTAQGLIRMRAPFSYVGEAGAKRVGFAHDDTVWTTILGTRLTDPQEIFETLTVMDFEDYRNLLHKIRGGEQ
jgi:hypothetical protein